MSESAQPGPNNTIRTDPAVADVEQLIEELAESYLAHLQAGKPPVRAPWLAAYPHIRDALDKRLALIEMLFRMKGGAHATFDAVSLPDAGQTLNREPSLSVPELPPLPARVGAYEILGELGRGGMGVVYKALHTRLNRLVALKMIQAGGSARLEERVRFQVEAQSLASLQHPNIVQVFEVGDHQGLPFLALEFIEGGGMDQMILARPQPARVSAQLVETLARGMHCAHQRGIIHRDLKPANVLLQGPGKQLADFVPKITDFGLAKRLEEDAGPTRTTGILGTPCYMAPEQAEGTGRPITPAADVYGLGAILYEMLTGRPPFRAATSLATVRMVLLQEVPRPSQFQPALPRDLETICLKCLQKDPRHRYATAEALADDLRRFRVGEPIHARPVPRWERAWMWTRRRPAVATLIAVCVVAVLGFLIGGLWYNFQLREERNRANANLHRALDAVHAMLTEVGAETLEHEPQMEEKRRQLLLKALTFYQEFLRDQADNPLLRSELALAKKSMADVLRYLDQYHEAETAYREALPLLAEAETLHPQDTRLADARADGCNGLGEALRQSNQPRAALAAYQQALDLWRALAQAAPHESRYVEQRARVRYNLALALRSAGESRRAEEELGTAIALLTPLHSEAARQHLARCHINLGVVLKDREAFAAAEQHDREAIALLTALHQKVPQMPEYEHELAVAYNNLGNLSMTRLARIPPGFCNTMRKLDCQLQARAAHEKAIERLTRLQANFPRRRLYRQELANAYNGLGNVKACAGDFDGAEQTWNDSCGILRQLVEENPRTIDYRGDLGLTWGNMGVQRASRQPVTPDDWTRAFEFFRKAVASLEATLQINPHHPDYRRALRNQYRNWAEASIQTGKAHQAQEAAGKLARLFPTDATDSYHAACFTARCLALVERDPVLKQQYADEVIQHLRNALQNGFKDEATWDRDDKTIFALVQQHPGYQKLRNPHR